LSPKCFVLCSKGHEFTYWAPLEFEPGSGAVKTFRPFLDNVTLDLAESFS